MYNVKKREQELRVWLRGRALASHEQGLGSTLTIEKMRRTRAERREGKGSSTVKFKIPVRHKRGHRVPFLTDEETASPTQDRKAEEATSHGCHNRRTQKVIKSSLCIPCQP